MLTPFGELPDDVIRHASMAEQHDWLHRRISRRSVLRAGGVTAAALTPMLWTRSARADSSTTAFAPHLAYGTDPTTSMNVSFGVTGPAGSAGVRVRHPASGADFVVPSDLVTVRTETNRYGRAVITGLRPDTQYSYDVLIDGAPSVSSTLRTAPPGPTSFRFTAFGDQAYGVEPAVVLGRLQALQPRLHLLAGDLCYADGTGAGQPNDSFNPLVWDAWLTQNSPLARTTPWMCAVGNHDMEPGFGEHGYAGVLARLPLGGASPLTVPVASTYRVGNVGFIGLDSNDVSYEIPANRGWTHGAQTTWLRDTLAAMRRAGSGIEFVVVYLHHSPYCTNITHGSEGGVRQSWVPLFDQYTVDLVISGHNHCYERTLPLRAGQIVGSASATVDSRLGTTYVTAGGGGQVGAPSFRSGQTYVSGPGLGLESAPWSLPTRTGAHAVLCVDVEPAQGAQPGVMRVRAIGVDGTALDDVTLQRSAGPGALAGAPTVGGGSSSELPWLLGAGGAAVVVVGGAVTWGVRRSAAASGPSPDDDPGPAPEPEPGGPGPA